MEVYVLFNKKKKQTKIGFTENLSAFLKKNQEEDRGWILIQKEKYRSKKNALIRVKQLKNRKVF